MKVLQQVKWEQKQFWRNPPAAVFTFVFPLMFLLIFSSLYSSDRIAQLGNIKFVQQYVPAIVAFGLISACYTNLAFTLSLRRAQGILKRKRGTPLTVFTYMGWAVGIPGVFVSYKSFFEYLPTVKSHLASGRRS